MPLFKINGDVLSPMAQVNFDLEKKLQTLIERSLKPVFNCRFIASEFSTGALHAGRIDTLALSEEDNPVIIEYKKVQSSALITQSLFYLHWLNDHRGDFELAARKALGNDVKIDWSAIRVICIAPNYPKYDLHAVQAMGADIELWTYRRFDNGTIFLEDVFSKSMVGGHSGGGGKGLGDNDPKPPIVPPPQHIIEQHFEDRPAKIAEWAQAVREYITGLDSAIEEVPKKCYIAYRTSQNIACLIIQKQQVIVFLKVIPKDHLPLPPFAQDASDRGHFGTGDLQINIQSDADLEAAKPYFEKAYRHVGA